MESTVRYRPSVESIDPATGKLVERIESVLPLQLESIRVASRADAQPAWAAQPLSVRCDLVRRLGQKFSTARRQELVECVTRETGKPLVESKLFGEILHRARRHRLLSRVKAPKVLRDARTRPAPSTTSQSKQNPARIGYEPYGVIGIIFSLELPVGNSARARYVPAIVAGNAVMLKPSEVNASAAGSADRGVFRRKPASRKTFCKSCKAAAK